MHVKSLMIPFEKMAVLRTTDTVENAIKQIDSANLLSLPVVDEADAFVGILSKRYVYEVFFKEAPKDREAFLQKHVLEFIKTRLPMYEENIYIEEAALHLIENKMRFLPIVDQHTNRLKGIITSSTLLEKYRDFFGMKHPKIIMDLYDFKGQMYKISDIIYKNGGNIKNTVQVELPDVALTELTLRIECEDIHKIVKKLESHKFEVREVVE